MNKILEWFKPDPDYPNNFSVIDFDEKQIKAVESRYGNSFVRITLEDIAALKQGKILYHDNEEYVTFVMLEGTHKDGET